MKCGTYKRSSRSTGSGRKSTTKRTRVKPKDADVQIMTPEQYLLHIAQVVLSRPQKSRPQAMGRVQRPTKARLRGNRN